MMEDPGLWERECLLSISWAAAARGMATLAERVAHWEQQPSCIVAVARGGLPLGVFLSHHLRIPRLVILWCTRNSGDSVYSARGEPRVRAASESVAGEHVLVADDIAGDGRTLQCLERYLLADGARSVRSVVLVRNAKCACSVDLHAFESRDWVLFPWERLPSEAYRIIPIEERRCHEDKV